LITSCDRLISLFWRNCFRLTMPTFFNSISWKKEKEMKKLNINILKISSMRSLKHTILLILLLLSFLRCFLLFRYFIVHYTTGNLFFPSVVSLIPPPFCRHRAMKANSQDDIWLIGYTLQYHRLDSNQFVFIVLSFSLYISNTYSWLETTFC